MSVLTPPLGPRGKLVSGNLPEFASNPLRFLSESARSYGPVVRLRFGRTSAYLLNEPGLIEEVFIAKRNDFIKSKALRAQRLLLGNGLLTNENESWLQQRRLAQP
ncbi:MAG: cytochrome P450, partial [Anaerolineae bacterium]|nr:cytochrome P450 [Gemmatimonadaceae bacterium]